MASVNCLICQRPACLFGSIDEETNWRGWCRVCNWKWRWHTTLTSVITSKLFDKISLRLGDRCVQDIVMSYIRPQGTLRSIQQEAMEEVWEWFLLGRHLNEPMLIDSVSGRIREANSDDETWEENLDPHLNYVNVLWKLQLSIDSSDEKLIRRVIRMLGPLPPDVRAVGVGSGITFRDHARLYTSSHDTIHMRR